MEEIKRLNEFKAQLMQAIEMNSKLWHMTNDENYKNELHNMNEANRDKLEDIQIQLRKFA
jgi:hypothetical protein